MAKKLPHFAVSAKNSLALLSIINCFGPFSAAYKGFILIYFEAINFNFCSR